MQDRKTNFLKECREKQRFSLKKLSVKLGILGKFASEPTLNRWERGVTQLPDSFVPELAKILKVSEDELLFGPNKTAIAANEPPSLAFVGLNFDIAESIINMGFTSWIASKPEEAKHAVQSVLPWLETLVRRSTALREQHEGKHLLARGHELLGALAMDQVDNAVAIAEFRRALTFSEELGDQNLIAAHMTELGEANRRKGNIDIALLLMQTALEISQQARQATKGYVLEMLAYTYAEAGQEKEFRNGIEHAVDLLGHSGESEGVSKREFIPFEVLEIYGKALRDFGYPEEAIHYLEKAEQSLRYHPFVPRWQAVVTISKSQAYCDGGDLEAGIDLAVRGIMLAHSCQSPRQMNRVRKLLLKLESGQHSDATQLAPLRDVVSDIYINSRNPHQWHPQHPM